eukprot:s8375_g1.t1
MTRCLQRCALDKYGVWRVKSTVKLQKGQKQERVESSATRATASKSKKGPKVKQSAAEATTERQVAQTAAEARKERRKELQRGYEKTRQEKLKKSGMKVYRPREGLNVGQTLKEEHIKQEQVEVRQELEIMRGRCQWYEDVRDWVANYTRYAVGINAEGLPDWLRIGSKSLSLIRKEKKQRASNSETDEA